MGAVGKTVKPQQLRLKKGTKEKLDKRFGPKPPKPEAKTPSAANVRAALASGNITPLEAADLNPQGGLKPKASDVRSAYKGGKISREEAEDLNPQANLNTDKGSKAKASGKAKGPIKVKSERVYRTNPGPTAAESAASSGPFNSGPSSITPPGPSIRGRATSKAASAKKGTKNTSTIKVAQRVVDLDAPGYPTVYNITDVPRQWKKNG